MSQYFPKYNQRSRVIARNTLMLYVRLLVMTLVTIYTSRVVLNVLGVSDFGIYNLVAGIIVLFSFINTAMSSSTQRFLSFELGRNDENQLRRVFSVSMTAHIMIAAMVLILGETIGLWFVNTQLAIPQDRMYAANWAYQFTIFSAVVNIIRVPFNGAIIAHEKMSFYAYVGIIEAFLRLGAAVALMWVGSDKLIMYSILMLVVSIALLIAYRVYSRANFRSTRYGFIWDRKLFLNITGFSAWNMLGAGANVGAHQGVNILFNIFNGLAVNAALGVANQLSSSLYSFVANFQTAFNPQIVKSYAEKDLKYMRTIIDKTSKFSFYLIFIIALPVLLETEAVLNLWLVEVPAYAASFCRLIIMFFIVDALSGPIWMAVSATGRIRVYQIVMSIIILINIPVAYILLKNGYPPEVVLFVRLMINTGLYFIRIFYLGHIMNFSPWKHLLNVMPQVLCVVLLSLPLPLLLVYMGANSYIIAGVAALCVVGSVFAVGLKADERRVAVKQLSGWLKSKKMSNE